VIDIGSVINGKYRLMRVLGDGGMGSVYEALHLALGTRVAVKVLHPELARRTGLVERFLQEARVAAQIRSPYVVQVTDVDRTPDGYAYIVMELLEGEPLSSLLDRQRKLSVTIACAYATQILQALEAAHALGVIHRDLKPENVFVTFAGGKPVLKLIDFGIAKARPADQQQKRLTVAGVVMGTAEYMAPEQARSADAVDARADIYAVGVMLYEMIAGARPVGGNDARIIALKVERGEVIALLSAAPDTPREVAGLVHRAMAPRPEMRFSSATEMRLAVEAAATGKRPSTAAMAGMAGAHPTGSGSTVELAGRPGATPAPAHGSQFVQGAPPSRPGTTPSDHEPAVVTIRAPPIATALAPAAYAGPPVPAFSAPGAPPHRSSGRRWVVASLALLAVVFAGVVASALMGVWNGGPSAPASPSLAATEEPPAAGHTGSRVAPPAATEAPASSRGADLPSLVPTKPSPVPGRPPGPAPQKTATAPAGPDAAPPAIVFYPPSLPSSLPFPSGFPLPAGFPTALPSAFPTALPSNFPTWPPAPPQPAPAPAPSASGAVY
jgi:tRNA A-37 threonylcarbamoyl transferase component Bud32